MCMFSSPIRFQICEICHTQNDNLARAPNGKISCQECFEQGVKQSKIEKCDDCGVKFEGRIELDKHDCRRAEPPAKKTKRENSTGKSSKAQSAENRTSIEPIAAHAENQLETQFECKLCHANLDSASNLQVHLIEHNFQGCHGFTCYFCSSIFTTARSLSAHLPAQHSLENKPFDCNRCEQTFYFRAELENHELTEHREEANKQQQQEERSALEPEVQMTEDADDEELVVA